jgi:hypothetical protein
LDFFRDKARSAANCDRESKQRFNEGSNFSKNPVLRPKADPSKMHSQLENPMGKLGIAEESRFWSQAKIPFGENERRYLANSQ